MTLRDEKKQQTRQALMEAALWRISKGHSFDGLSLREVTYKAGVTPASFYRHFKSMDQLGIALVDETCQHLRRLIRNARQDTASGEAIVHASVATFIGYVTANRSAFQFLARERYGGCKAVRVGIAREIHNFVLELSTDLIRFPHFGGLPRADLEMISALIVNTVINTLGEIMELAPDHPDITGRIASTMVNQIRVIVLGGLSWKPGKRVPSGGAKPAIEPVATTS